MATTTLLRNLPRIKPLRQAVRFSSTEASGTRSSAVDELATTVNRLLKQRMERYEAYHSPRYNHHYWPRHRGSGIFKWFIIGGGTVLAFKWTGHQIDKIVSAPAIQSRLARPEASYLVDENRQWVAQAQAGQLRADKPAEDSRRRWSFRSHREEKVV